MPYNHSSYVTYDTIINTLVQLDDKNHPIRGIFWHSPYELFDFFYFY